MVYCNSSVMYVMLSGLVVFNFGVWFSMINSLMFVNNLYIVLIGDKYNV